MSKIIQERKKEEELAVAKPRSVCLISASLNKGQSSHFGAGVSISLGTRRWIRDLSKEPREIAGRTVSKEPQETAGRTLSKTVSQKPKMYSQVWKGDNQSERSCGETAMGRKPRQHA